MNPMEVFNGGLQLGMREFLTLPSAVPDKVMSFREVLGGQQIFLPTNEKPLEDSPAAPISTVKDLLLSLLKEMNSQEEGDDDPHIHEEKWSSLLESLYPGQTSRESINLPDVEDFRSAIQALISQDKLLSKMEEWFRANEGIEGSAVQLTDQLQRWAESFETTNLAPTKTPAIESEDLVFPTMTLVSEKNQADLEVIGSKIIQFLHQWRDQPVSFESSRQMLQLLKQWSQLQPANQQGMQLFIGSKLTEQEKQIWERLITNYQNRQDSSLQRSYAKEITAQDISKWVKKALEHTNWVDQQPRIMESQVGQSSSKVQQYVIHLQQTQSEERTVQQQLIQQFQRVMQKSNFMQLANGDGQLTVQLKPEHLGEITVRLVQMNGEMTVKMLVHSQAAKELLETNIQQLRHLFSPQQVVVEKQETFLTPSSDELTQEQESYEEEQGEQGSDHEEQSASSDDNEIDFHELLMEMKV
ncbi:flagellar hook-length control protein FliK [Gracilibacillus phocaeensis]|uniref:flagellar hook-length control protein FliK n=1 Tax=Gracilibacillus phocaeensis TaxID=2042304 RepID=UPI0013EEF536|nr:flagellar hook-length control protein FliK [Gracilibacillus phocaeensis]